MMATNIFVLSCGRAQNVLTIFFFFFSLRYFSILKCFFIVEEKGKDLKILIF